MSFFNFRLNLISQTPWGENREQVSNCPALNPGHPGLSYQCSATELQQPDNRKKADGTSKVSSSEDNFTHLSWATRATLVWWLSRVYQHSDTRMWTLDPATLMISSTLSFSFCGQCFYLHKLFSIFHPVHDISRNHTCYVKYEEDQILLIRPIILGPIIFTKLFSIFYPYFQESYRLCKIWRASNFVFTKLFLLPWNCNKLSYSRLVESSITLLLDHHTGIKTCFSFASFPIPEHEYTGRGRVSFNFLTWAKSA